MPRIDLYGSAPAPLLLRYSEAAALCSVSTKSIKRAVEAGELRAVQAPGTIGSRGRRILHQDVARWLSLQVQQAQRIRDRIALASSEC